MSDPAPEKWYAPPVERAAVTALMKRSNGRALASYGLWLLLLAGLGWLSSWLFTLGSPGASPSFFSTAPSSPAQTPAGTRACTAPRSRHGA